MTIREPNMKALIESLASEELIEAVFTNDREADEEVAQLLYFMGEGQTATLYKGISELDQDKKKNVLASLVRLYPLSKNIVLALILKREAVPADFLDIYDMDRKLLTGIRNTLEEMKDSSNAVSIWYNRYLREVQEELAEAEQLKAEIARLNDVSDQLREKREAKCALQEQLDGLRKDSESGDLEAEIEELRTEIQELEARKAKKTKEKKKLDKELQEIKDSLAYKEGDAARRYSRAFASLEKCLKSISEGE